MILVGDIEGDGFLDEITKVHCLVLKDYETSDIFKFYGDETVAGVHGSIQCGLDFMNTAESIVFHNGIEYDLPVLDKLYGYKYNGEVIDTLVISRLLGPDRRLPEGCPGSILNPMTNKKDKIGPHALAAWGYRVGLHKPEYFDWSTFTMEMLDRCIEDVNITDRVLRELILEANA